MNIADLKKAISDLPDDMLVVGPGSDHSYDMVSGGVAEAEIMRNKYGRVNYMSEYYGPTGQLEEGSTVEKVFVVGTG